MPNEFLPNTLLIGAMKSGTTGLYLDLARHAHVFEAQVKEPNALLSNDVLEQQGQREYEAVYRASAGSTIRIDASTAYSKRPDSDGVAARARKLLGHEHKVLYIVRHPVERIVSQYKHEAALGLVDCGFDEAVRRLPRYVQYSSYSYQLAEWRDELADGRVKIIQFEKYIADRYETACAVCNFLGLDAAELPREASLFSENANSSQAKPTLNSFWRKVREMPAYSKFRNITTLETRRKIRKFLLPAAPSVDVQVREETLSYLRAQLKEDLASFYKLPAVEKERVRWEL